MRVEGGSRLLACCPASHQDICVAPGTEGVPYSPSLQELQLRMNFPEHRLSEPEHS